MEGIATQTIKTKLWFTKMTAWLVVRMSDIMKTGVNGITRHFI